MFWRWATGFNHQQIGCKRLEHSPRFTGLPVALLLMDSPVYMVNTSHTLPKFSIAPEKLPSQEESSLPTIGFSWLFSRFREGRLHRNGDYHSAFDHCLNLCCAWALPCRNPCLNPLSFWCVFESVTGRCGELHEARINSEVYEILCMLLRTL